MENLGSEVGQKMRCAVKAKLIELGTGGSAGYIDDELPDYVMIMVANKRSKDQMIEDLNLFLGSNTEVFVTWLHQVLEKLQEVTLPVGMLQKSKRKSNNEVGEIPTKKDKKDKKKEKKNRKTKEKSPQPGVSSALTTDGDQSQPVHSITDVLANQLMENAKKTLDVESTTKSELKTGETDNGQKNDDQSMTPVKMNDQFDIPTITEIAGSAVELATRRKELTELEDLQKKINQAKRQLRAMGSAEESEDEDFLKLKDDDDVEDEDDETIKLNENVEKRKKKTPSPIVFNSKRRESPRSTTPPQTVAPTITNKSKSSVLNRLGTRSENKISLSANRRAEREIFVPSFRRKEMELEKESRERRNSRERRTPSRELRRNSTDRRDELPGRSNSRTRRDPPPQVLRANSQPRRDDLSRHDENSRDSREVLSRRDNDRDIFRKNSRNDNQNKNESRSKTIHQRLTSRVIVAPPRPELSTDEDEEINVPVNSVVKIKPRAKVPANKQASKNLLLRAVAEAQRSTALAAPPSQIKLANNQMAKTLPARHKTIKSNIIIEVPTNLNDDNADINSEASNEDEYVPEPVPPARHDESSSNEDQLVYVPRSINLRHRIDISRGRSGSPYKNETTSVNKNNEKSTQFVVTLDGVYEHGKTTAKTVKVIEQKGDRSTVKKIRRENDTIKKSINNSQLSPVVNSKKQHEISQELSKKSSSSNDQPMSVITVIKKTNNFTEKSSSPSAVYESRKPVKRLIIKTNDTTDDEERESPIKKKSPSSISPRKRGGTPPLKDRSDDDKIERKRSKVSPIKFDLERQQQAERKLESFPSSGSETGNKYDNLPPLLSAVTIPMESTKVKQKERCKYYPICRQGESCEFYHPSASCKSFPNCKFGDKCLYIHPMCKFDLTCTRPDCNFAHTPMSHSAPPLASHVVPVQNYKTISAPPLPAMCKFYPGCTNTMCPYFHPKVCRFGKNCINKIECNFYHHDLPPLPPKDKLKWISPTNA